MLITAVRCVLVSAPYTAPGLGVRLPEDLEARYPYRPGSVYRILGAPGHR